MILVAAPYVGPGLLAVRSDLDLDVQDSLTSHPWKDS
jgi:hypothetical protein